MTNPYSVKTLILGSGERFPVLLSSATGQPLFEPTIYSLVELRATNKATNTIEHALRAVMVLLLFLDAKRIDLDERIHGGQVLELSEIDALARLCRLPLDQQVDSSDTRQVAILRLRVASMEQFRRAKQRSVNAEVCGHTAANRIRVIRDYIDWFVKGRLSRFAISGDAHANLVSVCQRCVDALNARMTSPMGRNTIGKREGATPEVIARLLEVISPASPDNPWLSRHVKTRNELLIRWMLGLGVRRGELLNIKISDIDFRREEVTIARRADDPVDPRRNQPKVKTRDRKLPLAPALCHMAYEYVTKVRCKVQGARRHEFLLVADRSGEPLSLSSLNRVFVDLREKCSGLPETLEPHVLRHTWNDEFSRRMDEAGTGEAEEQQMRSFLMGWSPTSDSAVTYTRRHVRQKAQQVSLGMQADQVKGMQGDE